VRSVVSSGNIIFETPETDTSKLEAKAEAVFPQQLGFICTTIIRRQRELETLVKAKPFQGLTHSRSSYLLVTFGKHKFDVPFTIPYQPTDTPYYITSVVKNTLFTVNDGSRGPTTDLMAWLEKQFGKDISSRTWATVQRILIKMES
jgi:uncharacterized protein (DUF1697 family)